MRGYVREGDVIVVPTLDRLGRTVGDTLNLIHELAEGGTGVRRLADPIRVDSSGPDDPMAQLAVVLLTLFAQMECAYAMERAAHARAVATAKGRRVGRPVLVDAEKLAYVVHLRGTGYTIAGIVAKTGIASSSLYRHLPSRAAPEVTADASDGASKGSERRAPPAPRNTHQPTSSPSVPVAQRGSDASLQRRLEALLDANRALRAENAALRQQVALALGEQRAAPPAPPTPASRTIGPCS